MAGSPVRLAVIDTDSGFVKTLAKRLDALAWPHRVLASPVPPSALIAMRLDAVVVDPMVLGQQAWTYLDELCEAIPHLGVLVCTGASSAAQRVRGLRLGVDDWVTKPCHPDEVVARVEAVVRRRRRSAGEPRPLSGRVRPQAAAQARERVSRLALHPHPLRCRLPLGRRTGGGAQTAHRAGAASRE